MRINGDGTCVYRGKTYAALHDALRAVFAANELLADRKDVKR